MQSPAKQDSSPFGALRGFIHQWPPPRADEIKTPATCSLCGFGDWLTDWLTDRPTARQTDSLTDTGTSQCHTALLDDKPNAVNRFTAEKTLHVGVMPARTPTSGSESVKNINWRRKQMVSDKWAAVTGRAGGTAPRYRAESIKSRLSSNETPLSSRFTEASKISNTFISYNA